MSSMVHNRVARNASAFGGNAAILNGLLLGLLLLIGLPGARGRVC